MADDAVRAEGAVYRVRATPRRLGSLLEQDYLLQPALDSSGQNGLESAGFACASSVSARSQETGGCNECCTRPVALPSRRGASAVDRLDLLNGDVLRIAVASVGKLTARSVGAGPGDLPGQGRPERI